jgi:hypothetical protein
MPEHGTAVMEECFTYDDELCRGGHFLGGEALQRLWNAATLRCQHGEGAVTNDQQTV